MGLRHIFVLALLPLVIIQIFRRPHWGLYAFAALTLVRFYEFMWGFESLRIVLLVSIATLVAYLLRARDYEGPRLSEAPPLALLALFLGLITLSACFAVGDQAVAFARVGKFAKMLLFMVLMLKMLDDWEKVDGFVLTWILGTAFLAVWGTEQHFRGNTRLEQVGGGDTNGSNELGALFVLMLPIVLQLALVEEESRKRRWGYFGMVGLLVAGVAFTGSRSGFLALVVGGAILFFRTQQRRALVRLAVPLAPLVVILSIAYFAQRVEDVETYQTDWSAMSRLWFWKAAVNMVAAHPVTGVGPANFPLVCAQYGSPEAGRDCHSTFFSMIAEVGVLGFAVWIAALWAAIASLGRLRRIEGGHPERVKIRAAAVGLQAGVIAFLFDGAFHTFGYYEYLYWPIVLGQCLRAYAERLPEEAPADDGDEVEVEAAERARARLARAV